MCIGNTATKVQIQFELCSAEEIISLKLALTQLGHLSAACEPFVERLWAAVYLHI